MFLLRCLFYSINFQHCKHISSAPFYSFDATRQVFGHLMKLYANIYILHALIWNCVTATGQSKHTGYLNPAEKENLFNLPCMHNVTPPPPYTDVQTNLILNVGWGKRLNEILAVEEELICQPPMSFEWTTPAAGALPWWFHHFITGRTVSNLGIVWPLQMSLIQFAHQQVLLERMSLDVSHAWRLEVARWTDGERENQMM